MSVSVTTQPSQQRKTAGSRHTTPHFSCCGTYKLTLRNVCNEREPFQHEGFMPELLVRIDRRFPFISQISACPSQSGSLTVRNILTLVFALLPCQSVNVARTTVQHFRHTTRSLFRVAFYKCFIFQQPVDTASLLQAWMIVGSFVRSCGCVVVLCIILRSM